VKIGQATENDLAEITTWRYEPPYDFKVVSPMFAPPDGAQAGFNGNYSLTINKAEGAHPIWSDTCNADPYTGDRAKSHSSCHRKRGSTSRFRQKATRRTTEPPGRHSCRLRRSDLPSSSAAQPRARRAASRALQERTLGARDARWQHKVSVPRAVTR
jgi:hypothetical protein